MVDSADQRMEDVVMVVSDDRTTVVDTKLSISLLVLFVLSLSILSVVLAFKDFD